jgi:hypothetical protein
MIKHDKFKHLFFGLFVNMITMFFIVTIFNFNVNTSYFFCLIPHILYEHYQRFRGGENTLKESILDIVFGYSTTLLLIQIW